MGIPLAYIGLGSNLGDRQRNLADAITRIKGLGIRVTGYSSIYETDPVGIVDQPRFLNQVIEAVPFESTSTLADAQSDVPLLYAPADLLGALLQIEEAMGRVRVTTGGPRIIDLDLLLYGDVVISGGERPGMHSKTEDGATPNDLILPHPRLHLRRFVLVPLCEIAPGLLHPVLGKTVSDLLSNVGDPTQVRMYRPFSVL